MEKKDEQFSTGAALVELEFQERLLRALTFELARMREEGNSRTRSGRDNTEPISRGARDDDHHSGTWQGL